MHFEYELNDAEKAWMVELRTSVEKDFPGCSFPIGDDHFYDYWQFYFENGYSPEEAFEQEKAHNWD